MIINRKISVLALALLFLSIDANAGTNKVVKVGWFKKAFMTLSFDETCSVVKSPREICNAVKRHITYRSDKFDEWLNGREAWDRAYGDCEDFASAVSEICSNKNIKTSKYLLYPENEINGHVIVVGESDSGLWFSSNGWFNEASSLLDVQKKVSRELRWKDKKVVMKPFNSSGDANLLLALGSI